MGTATKAPTPPQDPIAEYLTNAGEAFDRILIEDEIARRYFRDYCFASLDHLGVRRHSLLDMAGPDTHRPTADQAEQQLQRLAAVVKEKYRRVGDVYEEHFLSMLQRFSYEWLSQNAGYAKSQKRLRAAVRAIRHEVTRLWDNPVEFITDPVTGKCWAKHPFGTSQRLVKEADAFVEAIDPSRRSPTPVGRPKGIQKPKQSGRAPLPHDEARAVFQAIQGDGKDWKFCARKILNKTIPPDHKEREQLRAHIGRLKYKGSILSKKSVR